MSTLQVDQLLTIKSHHTMVSEPARCYLKVKKHESVAHTDMH